MDKEKSQNPAALPDLPEGIPGNLPNGVTPDASTELSAFRTRMSEHRTNMSEHRTDLSEHRTSMSEHRTDLSVLRTHLSNERTHFSYVRTAVSLMSFGVTLNRFSVYLQENDHAPNPTSALAALLIRGVIWRNEHFKGMTIREIAKRDKRSDAFVGGMIRKLSKSLKPSSCQNPKCLKRRQTYFCCLERNGGFRV